jgi:hypothetical protein
MSQRSTSRASKGANSSLKQYKSVQQKLFKKKMKSLVDKTFNPHGHKNRTHVLSQYKASNVSTNNTNNHFSTHPSNNSLTNQNSQKLVNQEYFDQSSGNEHSSSKKELVWDAYTSKHTES